MKRFVLALLIGCWLPLCAIGQTTTNIDEQTTKRYTIEQVPNVQLENAAYYVTDPQGILSTQQRDSLNTISRQLRDSTTTQMAIVILPAIDREKYADAREFAFELFNYWKLGEKKVDNGLLILLLTDPSEREITFEVGYGLEEYLPDGLCKYIQTELMIPKMKGGDYGGGLIAGATEVDKIIKKKSDFANDYYAKKKQDDEDARNGLLIFLGIFSSLGYFFGVYPLQQIRKNPMLSGYKKYVQMRESKTSFGCLVFLSLLLLLPLALIYWIIIDRMKKRQLKAIVCEKCGATNTQNVSKTEKQLSRYSYLTTYLFTCKNCGKEHKEEIYKDSEPRGNYSSGGTLGSVLGGLSGGGRYGGSSGGGSYGGSYGGGSSGGGGASTKF